MDLNADLGEGFGVWRLGDDEALLDVVTSANVACGFHAGDPVTMRRVCDWAADRGVAVGAQVGLPRPGRLRPAAHRLRPRPSCATTSSTRSRALDGFCRLAGRPGALRQAARRALQHGRGRRRCRRRPWSRPSPTTTGRCPCCACPARRSPQLAAGAGLRVVAEGFADRAYRADGTLVPRGEPGARAHRPGRRWCARAVRMAVERRGRWRSTARSSPAPVDSICLHGDTPGAVDAGPAGARGAAGAPACALAPFACRSI